MIKISISFNIFYAFLSYDIGLFTSVCFFLVLLFFPWYWFIFYRKTLCAKDNLAFPLHPTHTYTQTSLLAKLWSKSLCNQAEVPDFPETPSGKTLGWNYFGDSLSLLPRRLSRSHKTPASPREEAIINGLDCSCTDFSTVRTGE